jgi:hypothetical protein
MRFTCMRRTKIERLSKSSGSMKAYQQWSSGLADELGTGQDLLNSDALRRPIPPVRSPDAMASSQIRDIECSEYRMSSVYILDEELPRGRGALPKETMGSEIGDLRRRGKHGRGIIEKRLCTKVVWDS